MSSANKRKGSLFETDLETYLNGEGLRARRLPRAGSSDIGDVSIELKNGHVLVLEAKNVRTPQMSQWLKEAEVEATHYAYKYRVETYGLVVVKARQQSISQARVTLTLEELADILRGEGLT